MPKRKKLIKDRYTFPGGQVVVFALAFAVVGVIALTSSFAAPRGGGGGKPSGGGTISLAMVNDQNVDGQPNYGDSIRFNVSTTATTEPHVRLQCTQNGTLVYTAQTGYYASYPWPWSQTFTLKSGAWTGGAADCTATMYSLSNTGRTTDLATLKFVVNA